MAGLTGRQIADEKLDGWAHLVGGLQTRVPTPDFAAGLALVTAIGAAAEAADHHPDLDLRYRRVDIRLTSHDTGAVTGRDIRMARTISGLIAGAGLDQECATVSRLELALDTPAREAVQPFWTAVLGGQADGNDVTDPHDALPLVWFQDSGGTEPRQHWHPDLWLDPAEVQPRIAAALAAGGTLVSDAEAPSFWVLADPEGNKICLCTWQDRA
ncbi:4a-hydroxytetrahydrobiopterin dehydratase [Actinoplanes sp. NPDC051494]|uniref:4a-hydroxytetrahydrobiopterin dehydratase n=1 Tax=Actinoplanes sp. NPDC051494 TaxID=3363907 RepID=UPI0037A7B862